MIKKLPIFMITLLLLISTTWASDQPAKRLLHATGIAELTGDNDSANIQVSIITENKYLDAAHKENAIKADAVNLAIKKMTVKALKIKTANYHVNPQKNYKSSVQEIVGYKIQNTLSLTLEEMDKENLSLTVSRILDTALKHGANQIGTIDFYIKNREPLVNEALEKATKLAIKKAQTLAKAANVTLGPLDQLTSDSNQTPIFGLANYAGRGSMIKAASTPETQVEAGESKISATVSVSYEIK